jgi:hypothetical protein
VLVGDDFPELGTDLVTALTSLNVNDFSHVLFLFKLNDNKFDCKFNTGGPGHT